MIPSLRLNSLTTGDLCDEGLLVLEDLGAGVEGLHDELVCLVQPHVHGPHGTVGERSDTQLLSAGVASWRKFQPDNSKGGR